MTRLFLTALLVFSSSAFAQAIRVTVDPHTRFQRIDGFGVNFTGAYFRDDQKAMFDTLINDLGATMFRVVPYLVGSDWEVVNDNDDPNVMNWEYYDNRYSAPAFETAWSAVRFLNSRGIRPVLGLMGPAPDWMLDKTTSPPKHKVCHSEDTQTRPLSPAMYGEFAEEVVSMVEYARARARLEFDYFSPFNETDCYPGEGPRIDPDAAPAVLNAIAQRLEKEGLGDLKLAVVDQAIVTNDYAGPILKDAGLMKHVGAFAFHQYGDGPIDSRVEQIHKSAYPSVPVWVTEYGDLNDLDRTAANDWKSFSLASTRRALGFLNAGASALFYFNAFDDYEECMRRLTFYGLFTSSYHVYTPRKRYYATRQLYHFVKPGAQRIEAKSSDPALTVAAFENGADGSLVVVAAKQGGSGRIEITLPDGAAAPRAWEVYMTTPQLNCQRVSTVQVNDGRAELSAPAEAVITLVGKLP